MYSIFRNLALILISAKFFALLARKCRAPQVVGEIIAGLVIGPCLLNLVQPSDSIAIFAEIGVVLLMFNTGLGTNLQELMRAGPIATLIACVGVAVPLAGGTLLYSLFYGFAAVGSTEFYRALFIGTIMTATSVSITVEPTQEDITIRSIFNYLNESGKEVYIAIDEFQQIAEYPEKGTEALLRSYIQFAQHVHFIFSGSKQHLMAEIFGSPKHPFYQSTEMMGLKPLKCDIYYNFCQSFFKQKGGDLSKEIFEHIYQQFDGHTWYIQCIMNRLYESESQVENMSQVNAALLSILEGREPQFESMTQFFTENQFALLKAIAKDGIVAQPTAGKFIKGHKLSGASSVKAALKILEDKELVYRTNDGYLIYDRFMDLWLKRI